jgi:hypothetical protein
MAKGEKEYTKGAVGRRIGKRNRLGDLARKGQDKVKENFMIKQAEADRAKKEK